MTNKKTLIALGAFVVITIAVIVALVIVATLINQKEANKSTQQDQQNNYNNGNSSSYNDPNRYDNNQSSYTEQNLPQFIKAHYIDIKNIGYISQFRSDNGHDFSDQTSTCSSMKHYFEFPSEQRLDVNGPIGIPADPTQQNGVKIYSPVDGTIVDIQSEQFPLGKQIYIQVKDYTDFKVRLFHIYPLATLKVGQSVKAGEQVGIINMGQGTDIAVEARINSSRKFYSIFEVMTDKLFEDYIAKGAKSKNDFILSEEYRKANPLTCNGERFTNTSESWNEWVQF